VLKAIKVRLYPNKEQQNLLNNHFGACRFIYNAALNYKKTMYSDYKIKLSKFDIINELIDVKHDSNFQWLNEVKAECLQNTIDSLDSAFKGFYRGNGYPKFKSKRSKQSFLQKQCFRICENTNKIIFLGSKIKFRCSEINAHELQTSKIKRITYSKDNLNHYYASILIENNKDLTLPKLSNEVGIDLGLKYFLITSDGEFVENPKFFRKSEKQLAKQQRFLSRKVKGSSNRNKQRIKIAKIHKKISNQRNYFLHEVSNKIIDENQVIHLETLAVKNMIKNHKLAKSIADASWSTFVNMLKYKSQWYGRELHQINRFSPSSKTCSECGWINVDLTLADRIFKCEDCGHVQDRDLNAAINIKNFSNQINNNNRDELTRINASGEQTVVTQRKKKNQVQTL